MRRLTALAAVVLALGCTTRISAWSGPRATAVETLEVEAGETTVLRVESACGNIVAGPPAGAPGTVRVVATKTAVAEEDLARIHVFARVEGATVKVGYTVEPGVDGTGVSFEVEAPRGLAARLRTSAGNLKALGFEKGLEARTSAGNVTAGSVLGDLVLESSAGNIVVEGADGRVDAESSAGNVRVAGRLRGRCRLESGAGNLEATLPADSRLKVDGSTSAGNARSEHAVGSTSSFASSTLAGTLGDGADGSLEMKTGAGNLSLKKLP